MKIFYITFLLLFSLTLSSAREQQNRFYSQRYALQIDLPEGYQVKRTGETTTFYNDFASIELRFFVHKDFSEVYEMAKRMGRGILTAENREVKFAHCRILRASRGGYLIFNQNGRIQHYTILKKEYRSYLIISTLKEEHLGKLKSFIESIRLLMPDEKNYEGEKNGFLYRLSLSTDYTYRFSVIRGKQISVTMGTYRMINSEIHLSGIMSAVRSEDETTRVSRSFETGVVRKDHQPDTLIYQGVQLKISRITY